MLPVDFTHAWNEMGNVSELGYWLTQQKMQIWFVTHILSKVCGIT